MFPTTVLALLALSAPPGPITPSPDFPDDLQWRAVQATVRISSITGENQNATGVTIGLKDGLAYVLTAAHAVATPGVREVHYFTQESYPERAKVFTRVTTVATWPAADVALLSVAVGDWPAPVLKLAGPGQRPKTFPTTALSVGCTAAGPPTAREEQIQAKRLVRRPEGAVAFFWQCQAASLPGRSGGPLLDRNGRVIGLAAATQSGRGFYAHLDEILAALKKHDYSWLWENK